MPIADAELIAAVAAQRAAISDTVAFVHAHPELAHEEHLCAAHLAGRLGEAGLRVEQDVAGLGTAFRAALAGERAGRRVGIAALYDAVAAVREDGSVEAVHSCGHGLIAGAVVGAALALAPLCEQLAGELVIVGCPADKIHAPGTIERGGGKWLAAAAGVWDDYDAVLYAHPEFIDTVWQASMWMRRDTFAVAPPVAITAPRYITVQATQIQYSQQVFLNFKGLSWPHVPVATLVPSNPIPVPRPRFGPE